MEPFHSQDLTIILYTANVIPLAFASKTYEQLLKAAQGMPIITVSHKPMPVENNIVVDLPRHQASIYRQLLIGAKAADTKFLAAVEDDCLYSPEHFKFRPKDNHWAYNMNAWSLYTWGSPVFSYKAPGGRRNLSQLICDRQMLIDHLEERFKLWPNEVDIRIFGEPGKYDNQLGTKPYPSQDFYTNPPNIVFSHENNLQFEGLGTRKAMGQIRALEVPTWGKASDIIKLCQ